MQTIKKENTTNQLFKFLVLYIVNTYFRMITDRFVNVGDCPFSNSAKNIVVKVRGAVRAFISIVICNLINLKPKKNRKYKILKYFTFKGKSIF